MFRVQRRELCLSTDASAHVHAFCKSFVSLGPCTILHLGGKPWHRRKPIVGVPRNHVREYSGVPLPGLSLTNRMHGVVYHKDFPTNTGRGNIINWSASRNSRLFRLKPISRRESTVSQTDDPFSATRPSVRLHSRCTLPEPLHRVLSSSALSLLTVCFADLTRLAAYVFKT